MFQANPPSSLWPVAGGSVMTIAMQCARMVAMLPVMMGALGANTHTHYHAALLALQCAVGGIGVGPGAIAGSARSSALRFFSPSRCVFLGCR